MDAPETRYVAVGDADVAYQVVGDGPIDLLYFNGLGSNVDHIWELPTLPAALRRLKSFRLILFDRRGTGASDGIARNAIPTWEEWTEDIEAVLNAAGSSQTAVLAAYDGGPISILFTAMHPERVSALALVNTTARYLVADDYPIGMTPEIVEATVETIANSWGTEDLVRFAIPSVSEDVESIAANARAMRDAATPRTAAAQFNYLFRSLDVRQALPLIRVPTLVLHGQNPLYGIEHGRYLAEHIAGATLVELPGVDLSFTSAVGEVTDEVAEFLTGERPAAEVVRILTTVLFTDIVGSTAKAASMGDQRWRMLLDAHDRAVRDQLRHFRGREINTTGDGFLGCFDGPARAIRCAQAIVEATEKLGVELRVGLHAGECEVRGDDLGGLAVHIAARVGALAGQGEILVSGTVKDLVVGSGIAFSDRGEHELKGVPGRWQLFAVER